MTKAADMAKVSAKGAFNVLWGLIASALVSSIGIIFIARLIGSDQYGLYITVLIGPTLIGVFRDWGVNSAIIRYAAQYRVENREAEIRSIFLSGIIFELALGILLTAASIALSPFIATNIFNRPQIAPLIQIASISILAGGLTSAATAAFTGTEKMSFNSIMQVANSAVKTFVILALVLVGFGASGATIGFTAGASFATFIGVFFMWRLYKRLPEQAHKPHLKAYIQTMLVYGIPVSLSAIVSGFLAQFFNFLLPIHYVTDNTMIGNYGVAANFIVLVGFFATPITTMLFPAFSKLDHQKDNATLRNVFQFSVKYASIFVVPVASLIICLSEPAVSTLFGHTYSSAPLFLALVAISYLYTALGDLSTTPLINSQGHTTYNLMLILLTAAIGFPMGYILIMNFGVIGLLITSLTASIPSLMIGLQFAKDKYGVTVDWLSSAKILASSGLAAAFTYFIVALLPFASYIRLIIGVAVFVLVLIPAMLLSRAVSRADVANLQGMASGLGPLSGIVEWLLDLLEKLMSLLRV